MIPAFYIDVLLVYDTFLGNKVDNIMDVRIYLLLKQKDYNFKRDDICLISMLISSR